MIRGLTLTFGLVLIAGCQTNSVAIGEGEAVWIAAGGDASKDEFVFCQANRDSKGMAYPVCTEAKFVKWFVKEGEDGIVSKVRRER